MSAIRTNAAAAMLGVSANTLRSWERRFGYPTPRRTEGGHRQFDLAEIETLRRAFEQTADVAAAVAIARDLGSGPPSEARLRATLAAFRAEEADAILEESMALRSVEHTVETVLLPAIDRLAQSPGGGFSPEYCFGWRYATGWLAAAHRVAPPASRPEGVMILDASSAFSSDALYTQALELFLRRAALRVLALPTGLEAARFGNALHALRPDIVVLSGAGASLDALARLVYTARRVVGEVSVVDFRGALPDTGASTIGRLDRRPSEAVRALTARLSAARGGECAPPATHRRPAGRGGRFTRSSGIDGHDGTASDAEPADVTSAAGASFAG